MCGTFQKGQQPKQGGFATAVGTGEGQHFSPTQDKGSQGKNRDSCIYLLNVVSFVQEIHVRPRRLRITSSAFTKKAMSSSTSPRAMPWPNSPWLVSRAMAVVMVRVA